MSKFNISFYLFNIIEKKSLCTKKKENQLELSYRRHKIERERERAMKGKERKNFEIVKDKMESLFRSKISII